MINFYIIYLNVQEEQKLKYTEQEVRNNEKYIYEYYDLELPPDEWLGICLREKKNILVKDTYLVEEYSIINFK